MNTKRLSLTILSVLAVTSLASCDISVTSGDSSITPSSDVPSSVIIPSSQPGTSIPVTPSSVAPSSGPISSSVAPSSSVVISSSNTPSSSKPANDVVLSGVSAKQEFTMFATNKAKSSTADDGFFDNAQSYKVGDDNNFNVQPQLTVLDAKTYQPVSSSRWDYDYKITATIDGQPAGDNYFSVIDARKCDVKFSEAAVGKTFTINVVPGGLTATREASMTKSITVDVVDGYNVYDAKELGYFDTREQDSTLDQPPMEGDYTLPTKWYQFKQANGLKVDYVPASLILQKDIKVTANDIPSNYIYTAEQAKSLGDEKAANSLVDGINIYEYTSNGDFTVDGNYFELDFSTIPLVMRMNRATTPTGGVVSHAAAFKAISGGDIKFQNINMSGNAKNAANDADTIYGGGLIFNKCAGSATFTATNIIATKFFITFMGERPYYDDGVMTQFAFSKIKCFNNYNSFFYNWGSFMNVENSLFRSCGGPIVIQDHVSTDNYEFENGLIVDGYAPKTRFADCELVNYVSGTEAWFQQFGATALAPQIMSMSDLLYATGFTKSFVTDEHHEGKLAAALSGQGQASFFNFIVFNKSGSVEGLTSVPNCGTAEFVTSGQTEIYNYRQPAADAICQAYLAYNAEQNETTQGALLAVCLEKGVITMEDLADQTGATAFAKIQAYITQVCTVHGTLRALNAGGAPIFDLGPAFDLLSYDGASPYLQDMFNVALEAQGQAAPSQYVPTQEQLAAQPNYISIYFNGMMLVFSLTPYVA